MAEARTALWVIQQSMVEMGLPKPNEAVTSPDATVQQMVALLNRAGTDMVIGFPWEQLIKQWIITTEEGVSEYAMPSDWNYFIDQTQWDRTNHWPLLGPKTAQEWQWLKGGLLSSGPRLRYRVVSAKFEIWPVPSPSNTPTGDSNITGVFAPWTLAMEYVSTGWLKSADLANTFFNEVTNDTDIVLLDPWVLSSYLKLKYWEAKGLDTAAYTKDFLGTWEARIGKNKGAPMLTLAPRARTMLIGINNIPDGSWNVGNGNST
jgi:hypothetical protein